MSTYRVVHTTTYRYEQPVATSYGEAHLLPRDLPGQRVVEADLTIFPAPADVGDRTDWFGNRTSFFRIAEPHTTLTVTARSTVEVDGRGVTGRLLADMPWEQVRDALADPTPADPEAIAAVEFVLPSPQVHPVAAAAAYAVPSFRPGRPVLEALEDLSARIHRDFAFESGVTTVGTPLVEVLARRAGVCQDFAHLAIAALRATGLAARYVSGYLETDPPPGEPKLHGADVSHAWVSVFVPGTGWVDIDPTNDQWIGDRHITTGWGRDYGDVSPLKGVIYTDGETESLEVGVDVRRVAAVPADGPDALALRQQQAQQQQAAPPAPSAMDA